MGRTPQSRKEQRVESLTIESLGTGAFALVVALFFYAKVKSGPEGNESMARIARYIREGAMAFLITEYKVLAIYAAVVFGVLTVALDVQAGLSFLAGAGLSLGAGFLGMKAATYANVRTAEAARTKGMAEALVTALDGGAVMGLCVAGLGLLGMGGLYGLYHAGDVTLMAGVDHKHHFGTVIHSFAVGASSIALFARIGGGIYTKAADVGADIVGKVEANIPEDDPRNPGVIADNVGDNVGDIAGMGADIYESYVAAVVAAMALGLTMPMESLHQLAPTITDEAQPRVMAVALPLLLATIGLAVSIVGIFITRALRDMPPARVLRIAVIVPPFLATGTALALLPVWGFSMGAVITLAAGALGGAHRWWSWAGSRTTTSTSTASPSLARGVRAPDRRILPEAPRQLRLRSALPPDARIRARREPRRPRGAGHPSSSSGARGASP
jgi:K(+)-stimulated pyrophosphate-energized sodium pump